MAGRMGWTFLLVAALGVCDAPGLSQAAAGQTSQEPALSERPDELQKVLSWLPADTETVTVARGPFKLAVPGDSDAAAQDSDPAGAVSDQELLQHFEELPTGLFSLKDENLSTRLRDKQVLLAVEGSRRFRPPAGLGESPFEGCEIAVFADDVGDITGSIASEVRTAALRQEEIKGQVVSIFEEKLENDTWTFFVAFPDRHTILVATDRNYLEEVLNRMQGGGGARALPATLPEWKYVDTKAHFWGLRHYDRANAGNDPTSPFGGHKTANAPDEKAIGITFAFDPQRKGSATITYLSGDKAVLAQPDGGILAMEHVPEAKGLDIRFSALPPDAVRGTYSLKTLEPTRLFLLELTGMFGHAIYI
jgi:hypothetical protein